MAASPVPALTGRSILLTRPVGRGEGLVRLLTARGARVRHLPLLRIEPCGSDPVLRGTLDQWRDARAWVFTSVNAVARAVALDAGPWPEQIAIGSATAQALREARRGPVRVPGSAASTSEALLADPSWQDIGGQRVLVCSGQGGRGLIAPALQARGAEVTMLALYRRVAEPHDAQTVQAAVEDSDSVVCTSAETLQQLERQAPAALRPALHARLLVVPSDRVLELGRGLGYVEVRVPTRFDDAGWAECLTPPPHLASGHPASSEP